MGSFIVNILLFTLFVCVDFYHVKKFIETHERLPIFCSILSSKFQIWKLVVDLLGNFFVVTVCSSSCLRMCFFFSLYTCEFKSSLSSNPRPYRLLVAIKRMARNLVNTILMMLLMDWVSSLGNCRWAKFVKMD